MTIKSRNMKTIKNKMASKPIEIQFDNRAEQKLLNKNKRNFKVQKRLNWIIEKKTAQQQGREINRKLNPKYVDKSKKKNQVKAKQKNKKHVNKAQNMDF